MRADNTTTLPGLGLAGWTWETYVSCLEFHDGEKVGYKSDIVKYMPVVSIVLSVLHPVTLPLSFNQNSPLSIHLYPYKFLSRHEDGLRWPSPA